MHSIAHRCARAAVPLLLGAVPLLMPGTVDAHVGYEIGHGAVAGTVIRSGGEQPGCTPQAFHETATAVVAIDYPEGTYAGPLDLVVDATSMWACSPFGADAGTLTMSASGSSLSGSISCRGLSGGYMRTGALLTLQGSGTCTINGVDTPLTGISQYAVLTPTLVDSAALAGTVLIGVL
jgi:hypothetical protein